MKHFGTDGIRGRVGEPPITAEFILKLGWAAGSVLAARNQERCAVVIGKDTRVSGYLFESALEAGLSAAGVDVLLLGPMPTPAIAHLTRSMGAAAGIVISASHNSYEDNGIKFFSGEGLKLDDRIQREIEDALDQPMAHVAPHRLGRAARIDDAVGRYIEYCKGTVTWGTRFDGLKIVLDCANGATYRIAPEVFRELGAEVISIHHRPDGLNINEACGSTDPSSLAAKVIRESADLGIAFDGDGDRVVMIDHAGELVDGDQILYLLGSARRAAGQSLGGVVGTVMSNFGLEEAFARLEVPFVRSKVGDRHVHDLLCRHGWVLGGETSGHILCLDRASTGCGIVSALQVVEVVAGGRQSLAALVTGMVKYPQVMINVPVSGDARRLVETDEALAAAVREAENKLAGQGRVILRPSGTEPVVRVTVEGRERETVQTLAEHLAELVSGAVTS
ncbi:MAG: phosphoglucosamine mutase [Wenzhouxiangella sp.]|jgi:phosphoglucosamine mutase|nr:phosphoglucosamine mutase [Wenzhouxiangella sp.]